MAAPREQAGRQVGTDHSPDVLIRVARLQDRKIRDDVFAMPAAPGQVPAMFAVALAEEGNSSDCECVGETEKPSCAGRTIELQ